MRRRLVRSVSKVGFQTRWRRSTLPEKLAIRVRVPKGTIGACLM